MKKAKSKNRKNIICIFIVIFLVPVFCVLGVYLYALIPVSANVQKEGKLVISSIKKEDIEYYLNLFNYERSINAPKDKARETIKKEFESFGYRVTEEEFRKGFVNIIADKGSEDYQILLGAHYDTVPGTVGADDNTSGLAALLSVAKYNKSKNIRFVAFDSEEYNVSGSYYYTENHTLPSLAIIFETIGFNTSKPNSQMLPPFFNIFFKGLYQRSKQNSFKGNFSAAICSDDTAMEKCRQYESFAKSENLEVYSVKIPKDPIKFIFMDLFRSDHTPFINKKVPAIMITDSADFRNPNYHMPSDTMDKLDTDFIAKQANAVLSLIGK